MALGLTVSLPKTNFMMVGCEVTHDGGTVEYVIQFPYLGSLIADIGQSHEEVDRRIASAFKAFGALR